MISARRAKPVRPEKSSKAANAQQQCDRTLPQMDGLVFQYVDISEARRRRAKPVTGYEKRLMHDKTY